MRALLRLFLRLAEAWMQKLLSHCCMRRKTISFTCSEPANSPTPKWAQAGVRPPETQPWDAPHHHQPGGGLSEHLDKGPAHLSHPGFCLFFFIPSFGAIVFPCTPLQPVVALRSMLTNAILVMYEYFTTPPSPGDSACRGGSLRGDGNPRE